jgi:riboflavin kinase/FMN adenylyltransferase
MLGEKRGFTVDLFQPVTNGGEIISSSGIRAALREGEIGKVNAMLGRTYSLTGKVEHGDGRGRSIGIPTANLTISPDLLTPGAGVYACRVVAGNRNYAAVTNIGYRPTFYDQPNSVHVEPHILDFQGDLYQQEISVFFVERLRGEQRFSSAEALVEQIHKDIQVTRELFGGS